MADSMNLDSSDLVGSLDEFEHLENIPGDFDSFTASHEEIVDTKAILPHGDDTIDMIPSVHSPGTVSVVIKEEVSIVDSEMETELVMDDDEMSMSAIGTEIDMDGNVDMGHIITVGRDPQEEDSAQDMFSGEIIEEVIVGDDQIIEEVHPDDIDSDSKSGVQLESIDHFVEEEVISESLDDVSSFVSKDNLLESMAVSEPVIEEVVKSEVNSESSKAVTSGIYVVATGNNSNIVSAQSFIPGSTVFTTQKDNQKSSGTRLLMSSVEGSGTTLRLMPGQSKMLSPGQGRTITLSQARQMGLFTQAKLSSFVPPTILPKPNTSQPQVTTVQQVPNKVSLPKKGAVAVVKSPTKILPVPSPTKQPQKLLLRQATTLMPGTVLTSPGSRQLLRIPANQTALGNIHQIQLPGKPVQYVKLVGGTTGKTVSGLESNTTKTTPVALTGSILNSPPMFKLVPISTTTTPQTSGQRVLIPATQASTPVTSSSTSSNLVVLPSHILQTPTVNPVSITPTIPVASSPSPPPTTAQTPPLPSSPPPAKKIKESKQNTSSNSSQSNGRSSSVTFEVKEPEVIRVEPATVTARADSWSGDEAPSVTTYEANGIRPRKPCNCTKSMCLKLYCDCFANGEFCHMCNCTHCYNNLEHEEERQRAIKSCLERNPTAFRPKIGKSCVSDERRHNKGCNCRRSGCLKNYCECYEAKIPCSMNCKCLGCRNVDSPFVLRREDDPRVMSTTGSGSNTSTLLRLMKAGDVGSQRLQPYHTSVKQAYSHMSNEVVEATCQCLLAQAEDWERDNKSQNPGDDSDSSADSTSLDVAQSLILEEFSRCVTQIIECVTKSTSSLQTASLS